MFSLYEKSQTTTHKKPIIPLKTQWYCKIKNEAKKKLYIFIIFIDRLFVYKYMMVRVEENLDFKKSPSSLKNINNYIILN